MTPVAALPPNRPQPEPSSSSSSRQQQLQQQLKQPVDKGFALLEKAGKLFPQGQLVNAVKVGWRLAWQLMVRELAPQTKDGQYSRPQNAFDEVIGSDEFPVESSRYLVYVGNACPWCHRVLLALALRGLAVRHVAVVRLEDDPTRARRGGWVFSKSSPDPVFGAADLWEVYDRLSPGYKGRCTAPLLVDARRGAPVCNESADILRMVNDMHLPGCSPVDLRPPLLSKAIDELNAVIYKFINNGVYRCGFATTQAAYDEAQAELWGAMDVMEGRLAASRFLHGDRFTESDLILFPTVLRMDVAYGPLFKCNRRRIFGAGVKAPYGDYPNLAAWARDIYQLALPVSMMSVRDTVDLDGCRRSYFGNLFPLNPSGIVPSGPTAADLRLDLPAGRGGPAMEQWAHLRTAPTVPPPYDSSLLL